MNSPVRRPDLHETCLQKITSYVDTRIQATQFEHSPQPAADTGAWHAVFR